MELWVDTCDVDMICTPFIQSFCFGITTNPLLLQKSKERAIDILKKVSESWDKEIAMQVTALSKEEMLSQALLLRGLNPRAVIKIPAIKEGFLAMKEGKKASLKIMATAIYDEIEGYLSLLAEVDYLAIYFSRIQKQGDNPVKVIEAIHELKLKMGSKTKILVASLKNLEDVKSALLCTPDAITVNPALLFEMISEKKPSFAAAQEFHLSIQKGWI